jgi:hypothetical protein
MTTCITDFLSSGYICAGKIFHFYTASVTLEIGFYVMYLIGGSFFSSTRQYHFYHLVQPSCVSLFFVCEEALIFFYLLLQIIDFGCVNRSQLLTSTH